MNISLSDDLKAYVEERVKSGGYRTNSEYIGELISDDQAKDRLRRLLLEGAASPLEGPADDAWFEDLRQLAIKHARQ